MPRRGNEALALAVHRARAAVVALDDVRVQCLVREEHEERLPPGLADEPGDVLRQQVRDVPVFADPGAVDVELRVERLALAAHRDPPRESRPRAVVIAHVPLAEEAGPVAGGGKRLRKRLEPVARGIARCVVDDAVRVRVLAGQDRRPAR